MAEGFYYRQKELRRLFSIQIATNLNLWSKKAIEHDFLIKEPEKKNELSPEARKKEIQSIQAEIAEAKKRQLTNAQNR